MLQPEGFNLIDNWPSNENKSTCSDRPRTFTPERIRSSITNNTICLDAFHPTQQLEHVAVHNHYGIQHLKAFVDQAYGYPFLYLNRASALGNLGRAGYPGDDYTANWASMKMALVQVFIFAFSSAFRFDSVPIWIPSKATPPFSCSFICFFFFFSFR